MATAKVLKKTSSNVVAEQQAWLDRLDGLVTQIEVWAKELDWSTRRITKQMKDSEVGHYSAPALLLQKETTRLLLEPIARSVPGASGVVDLYLMPAYDDIASLCFSDGGWQLHDMSSEASAFETIRKAKPLRLSKTAFRKVVNEMTQNAS